MEKPAVTGTQMLPPPLVPAAAPWANIGMAQNISAIARKKSFVFIGVAPSVLNRLPEVVAFLTWGPEASRGKRHKAGKNSSKIRIQRPSVRLFDRSRHIDHRQQNEDVSL